MCAARDPCRRTRSGAPAQEDRLSRGHQQPPLRTDLPYRFAWRPGPRHDLLSLLLSKALSHDSWYPLGVAGRRKRVALHSDPRFKRSDTKVFYIRRESIPLALLNFTNSL